MNKEPDIESQIVALTLTYWSYLIYPTHIDNYTHTCRHHWYKHTLFHVLSFPNEVKRKQKTNREQR